MIKYANENGLKVAARGHAHSRYGQTQVDAGVVIDMNGLRAVHPPMTDYIEIFGATENGQVVHAIHLVGGELRATILTYGATLQDVRLAGTPWPLTLGAMSVAAYEGPFAYFGAIVGPVANRIAGARALIDRRSYAFAANEAGKTTLHGGPTGSHA